MGRWELAPKILILYYQSSLRSRRFSEPGAESWLLKIKCQLWGKIRTTEPEWCQLPEKKSEAAPNKEPRFWFFFEGAGNFWSWLPASKGKEPEPKKLTALTRKETKTDWGL